MGTPIGVAYHPYPYDSINPSGNPLQAIGTVIDARFAVASEPGKGRPQNPRCTCYNATMTLVEVTYQLQSPLREEQLNALGQFANLYGLRRFRVNPERNQISLEYDGSRLREYEVAQALRQLNIATEVRV